MSQSELKQPDAVQPAPNWRIKVGFVLFILGLVVIPLLVGVMALIGLSGATFAAISGSMIVTGEIMLIAGAAIAGKQGYAYIKSTVFGYIKKLGPPRKVGKFRYTLGLLLFFVPALFGWAMPYFGSHIPGAEESMTFYAVISDIMLGIGLFLLGGDFWDKLRSLFIHEASALFPEKRLN